MENGGNVGGSGQNRKTRHLFHSRYRLILKAKQRNGDQDGNRNVRRKTKEPEGRPRA